MIIALIIIAAAVLYVGVKAHLHHARWQEELKNQEGKIKAAIAEELKNRGKK